MGFDVIWSVGLDSEAYNRQLEADERRMVESGRNAARGVEQAVGAAKVFGAARAGIEALIAGVRAYRGDWDAVAETLFRLPLGIGGIIEAANRLKAEFTGVAEEIRQVEAATAKLNEENARKEREIGAREALKSAERQLEVEADIAAQQDEFERRRMEAVREFERQLERLNALRKEAGPSAPRDTYDEAVREAGRITNERIRRIDAEEEARQRADAQEKARAEERQRQIEEEVALMEKSQAIEALRLEGREKEAQALERQLDHERRLEAIRRESGLSEEQRRTLTENENKNFELRLAAARRADEPRRAGDRTLEGAGYTQIGQLVRQAFTAGPPKNPQIEKTNSTLDGIRKIMEDMNRFLRTGNGVQAVFAP